MVTDAFSFYIFTGYKLFVHAADLYLPGRQVFTNRNFNTF